MYVSECFLTQTFRSFLFIIFSLCLHGTTALVSCCRTCPKSDPRFHQLVSRVTQNFDTFEDYGSNLDRQGKQRVSRNQLDQFYDYNYRRTRKPRVPMSGSEEQA